MPDPDRDTPAGDTSHDEWPMRADGEYEVVGVSVRRPVVYSPEEHAVYDADADEEGERVLPILDSQRDLDPEQTLGEYVERVGEEHGWERLSAFAREHLEREEDER